VTIVLLVEGDTEKAVKEPVKHFLDERAVAEGRPKVALRVKATMTPSLSKLRGRIRLELSDPQVIAVVGLINVYPNFHSAEEAKAFLRQAAENTPRFYPHAAQYDVEAWLLPYWDAICKRLGVRQNAPGPHPEEVDLSSPPSQRLQELYRLAKPPRRYVKPIEMAAILRGKDLTVAAGRCPEFRALLNTLLTLGGLRPL
jgi:hypothetical protein